LGTFLLIAGFEIVKVVIAWVASFLLFKQLPHYENKFDTKYLQNFAVWGFDNHSEKKNDDALKENIWERCNGWFDNRNKNIMQGNGIRVREMSVGGLKEV